MKHPIQPLVTDEHGIIRFKKNKIVTFLLEKGPFSLNDLAAVDFTDEDHEQFAQLIGYSLSGFGDLSYVRDETYDAANIMHHTGVSETEAMNHVLSRTIDDLKNALREPIAKLFNIHPDDLD